MKLIFFLLGLFLLLLRIVYPHLDLWHNNRESGSMITTSDNYIEGIWWSGKISLSDDERSIAGISPGGHLKFREQDTIMKAESDLQGRITYTLLNGSEELPLNDSGRRFIARQIKKMIGLGFFADGRAERIYQKGGADALLAELSNLHMEGSRDPYLKLLFQADTLTAIQHIRLLQLLDKRDLLLKYLDKLTKERDVLPVDQFDTVLAATARLGSDDDRRAVYDHLIDMPPSTEGEWSALITAIGGLRPDDIKSGLLLKIAPKMPRTDSLISAYKASAKTITGDMEYGKTMRAIE